jgi:hypothetical protein
MPRQNEQKTITFSFVCVRRQERLEDDFNKQQGLDCVVWRARLVMRHSVLAAKSCQPYEVCVHIKDCLRDKLQFECKLAGRVICDMVQSSSRPDSINVD